MATLTVTSDTDFRGDTLTNIDRINFNVFSFTTVTFSASQFGSGKISNTVLIDGNEGGVERIINIHVILSSAGTFSAAGWTFQDWQPAPNDFDRIFIDGSNGNDVITGTSFADTLFGSPGADELNGGGGVDLVSYIDAPSSGNGFGVTAVMLNPALNSGEAEGDIYDSIENLAGSNFDDVLGGTNDANGIFGLDGNDFITAQGGNDTVFGGDGEDTIRGQDGNDTLNGDDDNDTLFGNNDIDTLNGGTGNDTLVGGLNADVLNGGTGTDTASYQEAISVGGNGVTVFLTAPNFNSNEAAGDSYNSIENLTGSDFNDFLRGDDNDNTLTGLDGIDSLFGIGGNDVLFGNDGNDSLDGGDQDDTLNGGVGDDRLFGQANNDTLVGGDGDDTLNGADGIDSLLGGNDDDTLKGGLLADTLDGGNGIDRADFTDKTGAVVLTLNGATTATATIGGVAEDTVRNVENVSGGTGNDTLTGDALANSLSGGTAGADILTGRGGADVLTGNGGDDEFRYLAASDVVAGEVVNGGADSDALRFSHTGTLSFRLAAPVSIERILFANGSGFAAVELSSSQFGTGISNAVEITGNALQNVIRVEMTSPGSFSAENWTFVGWDTGGDIINLIGSAGADTIVGSSRADQITGGDGADNLSSGPGGGGLFLVDSNDVVAGEIINAGQSGGIVNLTSSNATTDLSPAQLINIDTLNLNNRSNATAILKGSQIDSSDDITLVLSSDANLVQTLVVNADPSVDLSAVTFTNWGGTNKTIRINGTAAANSLTGSSQNDTIDGGAGNDALNGGPGMDTADYSSATQSVVVDLPGHIAIGAQIGTDTLSNMENVRTGSGNDAVAGDGAVNVLDGGAGTDTVSYYAVSSGVILDLAAQIGLDGTSTDTLLNFENANGTGYNDAISGTAAANALNGLGGIDTISYYRATQGVVIDLAAKVAVQGGITDTILNFENANGSAHNDSISGNSGANVLDGLGDVDTLSYYASAQGVTINLSAGTGVSGSVTDTLLNFENVNGSAFADNITGNGGANVLNGLGGADTLTGGGNFDTFEFRTGQANGDAITDFTGNGAAAGDAIRLIGFGTAAQGATFTQLNATQWQIHSGLDGHNEIVTLTNAAAVHGSDFFFV